MLKKSGIILFSMLFIALSFSFVNFAAAQENEIPSPGDPSEIQNIKRVIGENTPQFIAGPIVAAVNALEGWRAETSLKIETERAQTKAEIKALDEEGAQLYSDKVLETIDTVDNTTKGGGNQLSLIWKYIKLFLLFIGSVIFGYRLIFYALFFVMLILFFRSMWRLVF